MMKDRISIHIGEYHASRQPAVIQTVLGSCVAVCLFDPANQIGGMNHIFLPGRADMKYFDQPARFGINAMELLINRILNLGGDRHRLVAKIFGGGHVISSISGKNTMGGKNVSFTLEFLKKEGIRILSKDVGGAFSRKVRYHTDNGEVYVKRIRVASSKHIVTSQNRKLRKIRDKIHLAGEVTLYDD